MFARGVVSLHTACPEQSRRAHLSVQKTLASKSRVSITSKLIQTKGLQVLHSGHLRKTGGRGVATTFRTPVAFPLLPLPPYNFLTNSSGLFKALCPILSPMETGPHTSWHGNDGPHRIYCALHSWGGFPDLCAVSVDLGRQAPRHSSPSGGTQESARGAAAPAIPCPFTRGDFRRPPRGKHRVAKTPSAQLLHNAYCVTVASTAKAKVPQNKLQIPSLLEKIWPTFHAHFPASRAHADFRRISDCHRFAFDFRWG